MRVGEVAERAGVNVETLRYYERRGLLPAPERTPSGHRRYDEETVRFLRAIKEAQAVGFTLAEIAEYLRAAARSAAPSDALRVRMAVKIDEIDARIGALRRMRDELARVVGCACTSLDHCTCGAAYLARRGRAPSTRPSLLHVTNGESAGNTLRRTALGGAVLPWQDVLHEGPVPALPRHELLRSRAGFLADCGWGSPQALRASLERRDRQLLEALRDGLQVVLWFEHDLYDQLQLLDALALAQQEEAAPELIVVGSFPGRPSFHGLGELTAGELETLWPARRPADPAALGAAAAAWSAFRAPDPTALAGWATRETPELPFLAPALRRLLDELPAPGDGLSGTERRALAAIAGGARTPPAAFVAAQRLEEAPFLGDTWFHRSLAALGQGSNRLVETDAGDPLPPPPPLGDNQLFARLPLRLTSHGERVLRGEADRVELLGIDRWIGGTHVTPGDDWRWDPTAGELVRPARGPGAV
ncbi:MAG TPA: MerR family transcriptional regulator [Miltoncostaeaceae bacterium]|nr:MerR family transcriptional regulator [Miltoncostaeaceae bacterium]